MYNIIGKKHRLRIICASIPAFVYTRHHLDVAKVNRQHYFTTWIRILKEKYPCIT
jgi:hypothetical protein